MEHRLPASKHNHALPVLVCVFRQECRSESSCNHATEQSPGHGREYPQAGFPWGRKTTRYKNKRHATYRWSMNESIQSGADRERCCRTLRKRDNATFATRKSGTPMAPKGSSWKWCTNGEKRTNMVDFAVHRNMMAKGSGCESESEKSILASVRMGKEALSLLGIHPLLTNGHISGRASGSSEL